MSSGLPNSGWGGRCPRVWTAGRRLCAQCPLITRAVTLFSYDRLMVADRATKTVTLHSRWLWLFRRQKTVSFAEIDYVDQQYQEVVQSSDNHHDTRQIFRVHLRLKNGKPRFELFRFSGMMSTWTDGVNSPRQAAVAFMELLAETLGVPAGPPVRHYASVKGTMLICRECGRRCGPGAVDCLYCGGALDEVPADSEAASV